MDTLEFLRAKAERLTVLMPKTGIHAVIRHIEIGEQHFQRGRDEVNHDLFSDVIYRANQAFEGSIRDSYSILAGKNPGKKKAFELECRRQCKTVPKMAMKSVPPPNANRSGLPSDQGGNPYDHKGGFHGHSFIAQ